MSPRSMAAIVSPCLAEVQHLSVHLSRDHCSALRERTGMDCLVSPMRSVLSIALMPDCRGRRGPEERERRRRRKRREGEREPEGERECCRNVSPGSPSWAGAGLQECSPGDPSEGWGRAGRMLLWRVERVEAGWGRAAGKNVLHSPPPTPRGLSLSLALSPSPSLSPLRQTMWRDSGGGRGVERVRDSG